MGKGFFSDKGHFEKNRKQDKDHTETGLPFLVEKTGKKENFFRRSFSLPVSFVVFIPFSMVCGGCWK